MNSTANIILIIALALILVGTSMFLISLANVGWDFSKLGSSSYETNNYTIEGELRDIAISESTAEVKILPSSDGQIRVYCYEKQKVKHSVELNDGVLSITYEDTRKWFERLFDFGEAKVDVYIPEGEYASLVIDISTGDSEVSRGLSFADVRISGSTGDVDFSANAVNSLKIAISTGSIDIENVTAGVVELEVSTGEVEIEGLSCKSFSSIGSTGDISIERLTAAEEAYIKRDTGDVEVDICSAHVLSIKTDTGDMELEGITCSGDITLELDTGYTELENTTCANLKSKGNTGRLTMNNVVATGKFDVERSTGDVRFESCDAAEAYILTDTGDVVGSFLTDKIIFAESDTGKIEVPKSTVGGRCDITTDTGKIIITIGNK